MRDCRSLVFMPLGDSYNFYRLMMNVFVVLCRREAKTCNISCETDDLSVQHALWFGNYQYICHIMFIH